MKKILVYGLTDTYGGVEKIMLSLFSFFDKEYTIDFVFSCKKPSYFDKYERSGFKYIEIPRLSTPYAFFRELRNICLCNNYDIAYCNLGFSNVLLLAALKFGGVKKVIFHSHNTMIDIKDNRKRILLKVLHYISRCVCNRFLDKKLACSRLAYKWMFGGYDSKMCLVHNAIDVGEFAFNDVEAKKIKFELFGNENLKVIGHIGRFSYQKNHDYILDVFYEIYNQNKEFRLLLVGEGEFLESTKKRAEKYGILNAIKITGFRSDVSRYYQAMDCFVLPSRFEGLPVVGIEAQASGLPCFFSDKITKELEITKNVEFLSINDSPQIWSMRVLKSIQEFSRINTFGDLKNSGYDLSYEGPKFVKMVNDCAGEK
ncbi:MAG: glycosyltransferase [Acidaminococcaceae bacterium]|nr:glycosyltransferase [Acidaminococcaceae bacterium]